MCYLVSIFCKYNMFLQAPKLAGNKCENKKGQEQHGSIPALSGIEDGSLHAQHLELPLLGGTCARPGDLPANSSTPKIRNGAEAGN